MHRDFFKCNPTNTGHYKYPKFENMSYDKGCHPAEVKTLLKRDDPEKYVVFYTRHTDLFGRKKSKVVGFFKVGKCFSSPRKGFSASEKILLPKSKCIDIDYDSRGVPANWGKSKIRGTIEKILHDLMKPGVEDISDKYRDETRRIMRKLRSEKGRQWIMESCRECKSTNKGKCYWGKKNYKHKEILKELYSAKASC